MDVFILITFPGKVKDVELFHHSFMAQTFLPAKKNDLIIITTLYSVSYIGRINMF